MNASNAIIVYEIFPRNHGENGDFTDIIDDLQRIHDLGVDVLWLMPIHPIGLLDRKGSDGCPYSVRDYTGIYEKLGNLEKFKQLIDRTHETGMKIIMDMVFNHTSVDSVLRSRHPEFFFTDSDGHISRKVAAWSDVVDLDYSNRGLWVRQISVLKYWTDLGIDGFRCDVAPMVPLEFWKTAREQTDPLNRQIWIAESVHLTHVLEMRRQGFLCHSDAELHQVFDFTYDYDAFGFLEEYFAGKEPLRTWFEYVRFQPALYPHGARKLRFLENHDCPRIASRMETIAQLKNWTLLMFMLPGANLIYAGQEYALELTPDLFDNDPVDWEKKDENFYSFFLKVIYFIKQYKPESHRISLTQLRETLFEVKWSNDAQFISYINLSQENCVFTSPFRITGTEVISGKSVKLCIGDPIREFPVIYRLESSHV